MQLTNTIKSIAIGSFDGIHLGHKALIEQVEAVVVIERNGGYLTPGYKRANFFKQACFFYHFEQIRALSAKAFVERLCTDFPKLESIVVGYDFAFGYKKEGDVTLLQKLFKGEVLVVKEVKEEGVSVHSRTIKSYLNEGKIEQVNSLLGRTFSIEGEVVTGQGLGAKELVATINLDVYDYKLPQNGVYATRIKIENQWFPSVSFVGLRITTDGAFAVETHVLDEEIGAVKGRLSLEFIAFIRENKKFNGLDSLKHQILLDITTVQKLFLKDK